MANEIKQIKVGNTTYNIEPYTSYLPLTGGAMTGPIYYQGTKAKYAMINWIDNTSDNYGNGIRIGGGGATIIGGGESSDLPNVSGGDEILYLMNDGAIDFYSNCQEGLSSARHMTFDTEGTLNIPGNVVGSSNTNRLIFRHLDGQNCNGDYNLYLQYHQRNTRIYLNGADYYIENGSYYNGTAAAANSVAWGNVTGKPSTFAPSAHNHNYLPLAGGRMTGNLQVGSLIINTAGEIGGITKISIGANAKATKAGQIAIGASAGATAGASGSIVIGDSAYVLASSNTYCQQLVIGKKSYAHSGDTGDSTWNYDTGQIVIGHCAKATNGDGCIVIGNGKYDNTSSYYPYASGLNSIAIGSADAWSYQPRDGARAYGNCCIAIGMASMATGSGNIAIGRLATATSTSSIAIGSSAKATGSYSIAIGTSVTATVSGSKGLVCIGNSSSNYRYYGGTATSWSSGSDIRDKTDIEPLTGGVDLIKAIQPIIYRENPRDAYSETGSLFDYDKDEHAKATKAGFKYLASFKAQEVAKYMEDNYGDESFNNIIDHERWYDDVNDENIDRYFMAYGDLVPFMFQAIKEQQEVIEEQEERINTLENKLNELLKRVD